MIDHGEFVWPTAINDEVIQDQRIEHIDNARRAEEKAMAKGRKVYEYEVIGSGSFPIDMLRYDSAHPKGEGDSGWIERSMRPREKGPFKVLIEGDHYPTDARWASFGWRVQDVHEKVL